MPARFIKSAVLAKDFPPDKGVEIAVTGRSNAGKSSLINLITNHRIAKVSSTPGKTRLLNFFEINKKYVLVDMPGYGWAARGGDEMENWQGMIENYLLGRQALKGLLLIMDIRREWDEHEALLKQFAETHGFDLAVVLTKSDKLTRNEINRAVARIRKDAELENVFVVSSLKKTGHEELEEWVYLNWVKPNL